MECKRRIRDISLVPFGAILGIMACIMLDNHGTVSWLFEGITCIFGFITASLSEYGAYGQYVIPVFAAVAGGFYYYQESKSGIVRMVVYRSGYKKYCLKKILVAFGTGAIVMAVAMVGWCLVSLPFTTLSNPDWIKDIILLYPYCNLLVSGRTGWYVSLFLLMPSLWCGLWAVTVMCITSVTLNPYIAVLSPVVITFAAERIWGMLKLPYAMFPKGWFFMTDTLGNDSLTFWGSILFLTGMLLVLGIIFAYRVRRYVAYA